MSAQSPGEVRVLDTLEALYTAAADVFADVAGEAVAARGRFRVALAGGTTPCRLHRLLAQTPYRDQIAWPKLDIFFADERAVHPDHAESNFRMARDTLLHDVGVNAQQLHRMQAERCDLDRAARDYEIEIAQAFAVPLDGPPPAFDLVLLGLGSDGHTASLFPDSAALCETKRWVVGNPVPRLATARMTFTYPLINAARHVVFLIAGSAKAQVLRATLAGSPDCPAAGVSPSTGSLRYLVDARAAAALD